MRIWDLSGTWDLRFRYSCMGGAKMEIRKYVTIVEETAMEGGKKVVPSTRKAAAIAVIKNPFAGKYVEDLNELIDTGEKLGGILGKRAVEALKMPPQQAESYGKAAIVGVDGELEHAAAILHPKLGTPMREAVGGGKAIIPSAKKMGGPGTEIDVPLHYKDAAFVRTHFDAMSVRVPDAPRADEIVVAIVVTDSGRPQPRIGGLKKEESKKEDGLR
jgi:Amino acid synthesis